MTLRAEQGLVVQAAVNYADEAGASIARKNFNEDLQKLRALLPLGIQELKPLAKEAEQLVAEGFSAVKVRLGRPEAL